MKDKSGINAEWKTEEDNIFLSRLSEMEEPAANKFGCFIMGRANLPIRCAEIILANNHKIFGILSDDNMVKQWAENNGIPYMNLVMRVGEKNKAFKDRIAEYMNAKRPDYLFSISNPFTITQEMVDATRKGAVNYHNALLPSYAGVNATNWAIINMEKSHGITWHFVDPGSADSGNKDGLDTGDIIKQVTVDVNQGDTGISLNIKCSDAAINAFREIVESLKDGQNDHFPRKNQKGEYSYFDKYKRPTPGCMISFNWPAEKIKAFTMGLNFETYRNLIGTPKISINGHFFIIPDVTISNIESKEKPGEIIEIKDGAIVVATQSNYLEINQILEINGKEIETRDFANRFGIHVGYCFEDIDEQTSNRIGQIDSRYIARNENFWAKRRLSSLQPIDMSNTSFKGLIDAKGEVFSKTVLLPEMAEFPMFKRKGKDDFISSQIVIFASFCAYLSRITGMNEFHLGISDLWHKDTLKGLDGLFAQQIPFPVSYNTDNPPSFEAFCRKLDSIFTRTSKRFTYMRDIWIRYPRLSSGMEFTLPVGVNFVKDLNNVDSTAREPNPLSLVIPETGNQALLFYRHSLTGADETGTASLEKFLNYFERAIKWSLENTDGSISDIEILSPEERKTVLHDFNKTYFDYPKNKTVHELFEHQVEKYPDHLAVNGFSFVSSGNNDTLTYHDLNFKANQLARKLRAKGIAPDVASVIMIEPSQEMIIGLLGLLKAGGAFLPVKDGTPADRVNYILSESSASMLLTRQELMDGIHFDGEVIFLDNLELYSGDGENLEHLNTPHDLAYIIYTSGSTGKPKGVMIEHQSLINLCYWHNDFYEVSHEDNATKYAGFGFDASVWEIFPYLVIGASLFIVPEEIKLDVEALNDYFEENRITIGFLPTQVCEQFMTTDNNSLRVMLVGGDKLRTFIKRGYKLYNNYGPTENTVVTTSYLVQEITSNIPIGRPLYNNQIYILDKYNNPQPPGIAGELVVGGDSLARGYVNKPEMTKDVFPPSILKIPDSGRVYRTGDLARWLINGNIEFLGRIDFQVKIRGYRIELGEIENQLLSLREVNETVVIAREDVPGKKYLCAYVVTTEKLDTSKVKAALEKNLPDYMIPSYFVKIDRFPLTPNGKIDTRALPTPDTKGSEEFEAPSNEVEVLLVELWQDVLGIEKIGVNDDFFSMGGDSIKAIQIISKLQAKRFKLEVSQLFLHKNIKMVAKHLKSLDIDSIRIADQGPVTGEVPLIPIQKWFFQNHTHDGRYFNHAVTLFRKKGYDSAIIKNVFKKMLEHHDALRMVFKFEPSVVIQENRGISGTLFDLIEISLGKNTDIEAEIKLHSIRIQSSIDWENGPLVKLGLFHTELGDYLLFAVHHAVIDGISWRILLEDFDKGYQLASVNKEITFQNKTDSFKHWANKLVDYSSSKSLLSELPYWKSVELQKIVPLPVDNEFLEEKRKFKHTEIVTVKLQKEKTTELMTRVNRVYNTEVNDILLTSVGLAFKEWAGEDDVLINMEGHGREEVIHDADISRTVGWFTIQYPLILNMRNSNDLSFAIRNVKETLRRVPNKGIGYGVLRYLTADIKKANFPFKLKPEIVFNYLGQFSTDGFDTFDRITGITDLNIMDAINPDFEIGHKIDIEGVLDDGCLKLLFFYNSKEYEAKTIEKIAVILKEKLESVIDHCVNQDEVYLSPSDLGYKQISLENFENITQNIKLNVSQDAKIQAIYPLSPMQVGMFFHTLKDEGSAAYFEQIVLNLKGDIDVFLMQTSINKIIQRYDVLRTIFMFEGLEEPLQVVLENRDIKLEYKDFSGLNGKEMEKSFTAFMSQDQKNRFDLFYGPLTRFILFKTGNETYRLLWSFHHILMDGWGIGIIREELREIYRSLLKNNTPNLLPVEPFVKYIDWIGNQDKEEGLDYWKTFIENYSKPSGLPMPLRAVKDHRYDKVEYYYTIEERLMRSINELASEYQVTLNTVFQAIWGVLLQKYNHSSDVIFGTIVSGRPLEIEHVDRMVGLFINMIPVRITGNGSEAFSQLLADAQVKSVASRKYEYVPVADIQSMSPLKEGLINHLLIFENYPIQKEEDNQAYMETGIEIHEQTNYNFNILIMPWDSLYMNFSYNSLVYEKQLIENVAAHFEIIVRQVVENPHVTLREINVIQAEEKRQLLFDFNRTDTEYPSGITIHQLFELQVEKTPENVALIENKQKHTYRETNIQSNRLASILKQKGVEGGQFVGVMLDSSIELIVCIMGILKAGAAYLPLAPELDSDRLDFILSDCNCSIILTNESIKENGHYNGEVITLDSGILLQGKGDNIDIQVDSKNVACLMYEMNSGDDRAVLMEHNNIINSIFAMDSKYPVETADTVLFKTPFQYYASIVELFTWYQHGGHLAILKRDVAYNPVQLLEVIDEYRITHITIVPSQFNQLTSILNQENAIKTNSLKYLLLSGEPVVPETIARFRQYNTSAVIEYFYGAPEISVFASSFAVENYPGTGNIPIGKPAHNIKLYVLNFVHGEPVMLPVGVPGELCVSGVGLARGYLKNYESFPGQFISNPFTDEYSNLDTEDNHYRRLFRTGEMARWLSDGNIEYLGPINSQIMIRGTLINTVEIESLILKSEIIKQAVVVAREDNKGKYLCAYFTSDESVNTSKERERLMEALPAHMVPEYFMQLKNLPQTPDGKVDRSELLKSKHDPHRVEDKLMSIESEVLHLNSIGVDDNFYELGRNPQKAAQLVEKINEAFNVKVSMAELFKRPTLRQFSEFLTEAIEIKYSHIQPAEPKEYYPQSSAQKRLYFLSQLNLEDTVYNIQMMDIYCKGFEKDRLEESFKELIRRHESLRTSFHMIEGEALQKICDFEEVEQQFEIEYYEADEDGKIHEWEPGATEAVSELVGKDFQDIIKAFVRPFDLSHAPLLRVGFINIHKTTKILLLDMHHIIADGMSLEIIATELWNIYDGDHLPPLRLQYKDYSEWLNSENRAVAVQEQENHWLKEFAGEIPLINLPTDYQRPSALSFEGDIVQFDIDKEKTILLNNIAQEHAETLYMVLFAAYIVLLSKITGQEDIVVGNLVAGRGHADLQHIVGMFINTLAIRNYPKGEKTFEEFLLEVRLNVFAAFENQDYPFEQLVSKVASREESGRNPLFDVAFGLESNVDPTGYLMEVAIPDKSKPYDFGTKNSKFDMTFGCVESGNGMECSIEFKTILFKRETIQRFTGYLKRIVDEVCSNTRQKLWEIDIMSEEERRLVLFSFNETRIDYQGDKTIHELFEYEARKAPGNIAATFKADRLTYGELDKKSDYIAVMLREKGIVPDELVGIMVTRSLEMIIALLGVLKAGASYVPIDPEYPADRVEYMINDSNANFILTQQEVMEKFEDIRFDAQPIDLFDMKLYQGDSVKLKNIASPDNLAYAIYTSGSTGKPKGVAIRHRNAVNFFKGMRERVDFSPGKKILAVTTLCFDIFLLETLLPLSIGLHLVVADEAEQKDPELLRELIIEHEINLLQLTPSRLKLLLSNPDTSYMRTVEDILVGGEAFPKNLFEELKTKYQGRIIDVYGPTETTVWSTTKDLTGQKEINIGTPIANTQVYIINKYRKLQPVGVVGELYIGGDGVARGYLNRTELTDERFVDNPFEEEENLDRPYKKIYNTGDLARWLPNGEIDFLGRVDHQVKIRGFRIETGEIESQILKQEDVKEAIVLAREDSSGEKYLCAYIVPNIPEDSPDQELSVASLREYLLKELPDYMVPSFFIEVDRIPLTPNGKVDRKTLIADGEGQMMQTGSEYVPPRNEAEKIMEDVWKKVLKVDRVSISDSFFELGGNSLKALQLVSLLVKDFDIKIGHVFKYKTISGLAANVMFKEDNIKVKIEELRNRTSLTEREKIRFAESQEKLEVDIKEYRQKLEFESFGDLNAENDFNHILITGATGYLGVHFVPELLKYTSARLSFLVRGETLQEAKKRLKKKFLYYFGDTFYELNKQRFQVVQGDLKKDRFGMEDSIYHSLSSDIDAVIHSAANVRHVGAYEEFYEDNVKATERLLEFSVDNNKKAFHFISTMGVCSGKIPEKGHVLYHEYNQDMGQSHENVYARTKFEAEKKVVDYREKGLNTSIYRMGFLVAHSETGVFQENIEENAFYANLKAFMSMGIVSGELPDAELSFIDYSARAVVLLMTKKALENQLFHLNNHKLVKWEKMAEFLKSVGISVNVVNHDQFLDYLQNNIDNESVREDINRFLLNAGVFESMETGDNETVSNVTTERTVKLLKHLDFTWPEVTEEDIVKLISHGINVGFFKRK